MRRNEAWEVGRNWVTKESSTPFQGRFGLRRAGKKEVGGDLTEALA